MRRLVLIQDEFHKNYQVVTGNSRIELVLQKTVAKRNAGYGLIMDIALPLRQMEVLKLGDIDASLALDIDCIADNFERKIDQRQRQTLETLVNYGAAKIKSRIETMVSIVKSRAARPGISPFAMNQVVVSFFPEMIIRIRRLLEQVSEEPNLPFLSTKLDETLNLSASVDRLIAQDQQNRMDIFKMVVAPELSTPYPPDEELRLRYEHFQRLMELWPSSLKVTIDDYDSIAQLIDGQQMALSKDLQLEKSRPGFFSSLFG